MVESTQSAATTPAVASASGVATLDLAGKVSSNGQITQDIILVSQDRRATIEIPEGTLAFNAQGTPLASLRVRPADRPNSLPEGFSVIGIVYEFGPDGATFSPPVSVSLGYRPEGLPSDLSGKELAILRYDGDRGWVPLETIVDNANLVAKAKTSHFTQFVLAASAPSSSSSSSSNWPFIGGLIGAAAVVAALLALAITARARSRRS